MEHLINHICFLLDASGSMSGHRSTVQTVFNSEVSRIKDQSVALNQETRVSLFSFDGSGGRLRLRNHFFDIDAMRVPVLSDYCPDAQTPLYDAAIKTWRDLNTISQLYGNHAFLYYVITDGEENYSREWNTESFRDEISKILSSRPDLTLASLAPSATEAHTLKMLGFPNVAVWDPSRKDGFKEAGETLKRATDNFMRARSTGTKRVNSVFGVDATKLHESQVKQQLSAIPSNQYRLLPVRKKTAIQPFVESWNLNYRPGSCYYELTKRETIQSYKDILIVNRKNGEVFGGDSARDMLGLVKGVECRVEPVHASGSWDVFVQSTSYNRNLMPGTRLIVML